MPGIDRNRNHSIKSSWYLRIKSAKLPKGRKRYEQRTIYPVGQCMVCGVPYTDPYGNGTVWDRRICDECYGRADEYLATMPEGFRMRDTHQFRKVKPLDTPLEEW